MHNIELKLKKVPFLQHQWVYVQFLKTSSVSSVSLHLN